MSDFSHVENINHLFEIGAISNKNTAFDYSGLELEESLDFLFQNMQKNLIDDENIIKNKVLVFFRNDKEINARATKNADWATIFITSGTAVELNGVFESVKTAPGFKSSDHVVEFLYTTVMMFIFLHEKAHHIQYADGDEFSIDEIIQQINTPFDETKNISEFDADMYASMKVCSSILGEWKERGLKIETLVEWAGIFSAGIYWFFVRTSPNYEQFYTYSNNHPHGIVRVHCILDRVVNFFISNAGFDYGQCDGILESFKAYVKVISSIDQNVNYEFYKRTISESKYSIQNYFHFLENRHDKMVNSAVKRDPRLIVR